MVRICIRQLQSPLESFQFALECLVKGLEFGFESFESLQNGQNLHSSASHPFRVVRISIRMLRNPFELLEFAFECFESFSNGQNLHSNSSNHFRMVRICIRMHSKQSNANSNRSTGMRSIRIQIRTTRQGIRIQIRSLLWGFKAIECKF